jgi:hypothetical protein
MPSRIVSATAAGSIPASILASERPRAEPSPVRAFTAMEVRTEPGRTTLTPMPYAASTSARRESK